MKPFLLLLLLTPFLAFGQSDEDIFNRYLVLRCDVVSYSHESQIIKNTTQLQFYFMEIGSNSEGRFRLKIIDYPIRLSNESFSYQNNENASKSLDWAREQYLIPNGTFQETSSEYLLSSFKITEVKGNVHTGLELSTSINRLTGEILGTQNELKVLEGQCKKENFSNYENTVNMYYEEKLKLLRDRKF